MSGSIIVQKYGGSSVATVDRLKAVAAQVVARARAGHRLVVVVSAMGDATDELLQMARQVAESPDRRELDMLLTAGERTSMALLAMAIREHGREAGLEAVSLTGSQSGIITTASHTNARIMEVRPFRVQDELDAGRVVIVAGYQGVSYRRDVTTLGRGGSDTTAVALAAALDAEACEIYSDVAGVFTADPRVVPAARPLAEIGYAEMQALAEAGAKVLNAQAVEFAKARGIAIYAKQTGSAAAGTVVRKHAPASPSGVRGIATQRAVLAVEAPGASLEATRGLVRRLDADGIRLEQVSWTGAGLAAVAGPDEDGRALARHVQDALGVPLVEGCGTVSLVGEGLGRRLDLLAVAEEVARDVGAAVRGLTTSSFRITLLAGAGSVPDLARALHTRFELDAPSAEAAP